MTNFFTQKYVRTIYENVSILLLLTRDSIGLFILTLIKGDFNSTCLYLVTLAINYAIDHPRPSK
jgi:hypothetical protein